MCGVKRPSTGHSHGHGCAIEVRLSSRASKASAMVAMTADMLQRGAALNGDTHGLLRCFADKCDDPSRTLHVVALGTSISAGHGVKKSSRTFAASFAHRIRTVGRAVAVVEHNLGMPGHQPHAVEHCLSSHLPETPDMVLVEYAAMPDPVGFERVVRRLLGHPASPAVVIVNLPSFAQGPSPLPKQTAAEIFARNRTLHALAEFDAIAAHYGLPTSSLWPAVSFPADCLASRCSRCQLPASPRSRRRPAARMHMRIHTYIYTYTYTHINTYKHI